VRRPRRRRGLTWRARACTRAPASGPPRSPCLISLANLHRALLRLLAKARIRSQFRPSYAIALNAGARHCALPSTTFRVIHHFLRDIDHDHRNIIVTWRSRGRTGSYLSSVTILALSLSFEWAGNSGSERVPILDFPREPTAGPPREREKRAPRGA